VVIGVEPLGHLHCRSVLAAARHGEIEIERDIAARVAIARRHRAQHGDGVQHLVVEREIVRRNVIDPGFLLHQPVAGAQAGGRLQQLIHRAFAGPVAFHGGLEFAVTADTGKTEVGGENGHGAVPH